LLKTYYRLTKPGIIYGNLLTATAGFLFASRWHIHAALFLSTLFGTALVIGSACVFNNYIDRGIDLTMARTKKRALVTGDVSTAAALSYAVTLGVLGFGCLVLGTNSLTVIIGAVAFIVYVAAYGFMKRKSVHGTLVGSIAGAAPIVAGYTAVTDRLDGAAILLFLMMAIWQMPHFYAIALYRYDDYKAAKIPVLPVHTSVTAAKRQIMIYISLFIIVSSFLTIYNYTGYIYLSVMLLLGLLWLYRGIKGYKQTDTARWARKQFFFSLIVVLGMSVMVSLGPIVP
jgi:protoheme IX farnesyltransferase